MKRNYILVGLAVFAIVMLPKANTLANTKSNSKVLLQERVCRVESAKMAGVECKNGDVFLYLPVQTTTTKLPVIVSALFCDFDWSITTSPESISCIFTDRRRAQWSEYGVQMP